MKKLLSVLLALTLIFAFAGTAMAATVTVDAYVNNAVDPDLDTIYVYAGDVVQIKYLSSNANGLEKTGDAVDGIVVDSANGRVTFGPGVAANTEATFNATLDGIHNTTFKVYVMARPTVVLDLTTLKVFDANNVSTVNTKPVVNGDIIGLQNGSTPIFVKDSFVTISEGGWASIQNGQIKVNTNASGVIGNLSIDSKYSVNITRTASAAAELTGLTVGGKTAVISGTTANVVLDKNYDGTNWAATPDVSTGANFEITGEAYQLYRPAGGSFTIKVTAENGTTTKTYTVNYHKATEEVGITGIKVAGETATYAEGVWSVKLTTAQWEAFKTAETKDVVVSTKDANATYSFKEYDSILKDVYVVVTAEDGTTTAQYCVNVDIQQSADATLNKVTTTITAGTAETTYSATKNGTTYTLTVPTEPAATKYNVVVTPTSPYVTSVKVAGKAVNKNDDGLYVAALTLAADKTAQEYSVEIVAEDGSSNAVYTLKLQRGNATPMTAGTIKVGGNASGATVTADAVKKSYTVTADTGVTVKYSNISIALVGTGSNTATVTKSGTTITVDKMVDGKTYKLTVPYTDALGAAQTYTLNIKCVTAIPAFDEFFVSTNTSGTKVEDFTSDYAAGTTKYELKDDFEVEALSELDNLYFQYDMASGFSIKSVTLNGETCSKKSGYYTLDAKNMEFGTNEVKIKVEDRDDKTTTYTIEFTVKADIPEEVQIKDVDFKTKKTTGTGSNISSSKCDISPSFDALTLEYDVVLDEEYAEDTLYIRVVLEDEDADIKASGAKEVDDDDEIYVYSFEAPEEGKTLTVTFTVEEGRDEAKYVFNISTGAEADAAQLKGLIIAENDDEDDEYKTITPNFAPGQYDYYVVLDGDDSKSDVYFQFELDDEDDDIEITVDGDVEDEWSYDEDEWYDFEIARGEKVEVKVVITDNKDDDIENTYTITVVKGDDEDNDEVDMTGIKLNTKSSGTSSTNVALDKTFAEKTKTYSATVASSVKKIYVAPSYKDSELVLVNGKEVSKSGKYVEVELVEGKNTIEVVAYAENLDDSLTYTITVTRGGVEDMSYLAVVSGSQTLSLSPAFDKDVHNYAAIADNSQSGVYFSAYAGTDAKITVTQSVTGTVVATKTISSSSYSTSGTFTLYTGINVFTVTVSNDSDAEIYYVSVYKQPTALNITKSEQKVSVDGGTAKTLYAYNINGNNFIKIRDLAVLLNGSDKQFGISYNTATTTITLTSGNRYTAQAGDGTALPAYKSGAVVSTQPFYLDGSKIVPMAYNIGGNNYLMIRDLAVFLDFAVSYNSTYNRIDIDTDASYNPTK